MPPDSSPSVERVLEHGRIARQIGALRDEPARGVDEPATYVRLIVIDQ